jgi:Metallopeptidase family M24
LTWPSMHAYTRVCCSMCVCMSVELQLVVVISFTKAHLSFYPASDKCTLWCVTTPALLHPHHATHTGVIVVSLGTRYQSYCANLSRTVLINPGKSQEGQYAALLAAHDAACAALVEGAQTKAAMEAAVRVCIYVFVCVAHSAVLLAFVIVAAAVVERLRGAAAACVTCSCTCCVTFLYKEYAHASATCTVLSPLPRPCVFILLLLLLLLLSGHNSRCRHRRTLSCWSGSVSMSALAWGLSSRRVSQSVDHTKVNNLPGAALL